MIAGIFQGEPKLLSAKSSRSQCQQLTHHFGPARRICFSFFNFFTTEMEMLSVLATISGGVRANHCVKLISATRSLL